MAKGGKQPGAGRPKGSTNVPRFSDYITEADRKTFVEFILERRDLTAEYRPSSHAITVRSNWEHSMPGVEGLRYCITFCHALKQDAKL